MAICKHECRTVRSGLAGVLMLPDQTLLSLDKLGVLPVNVDFPSEVSDILCMVFDRGASTEEHLAFRRAGETYIFVPRNRNLVIESLVTVMCASRELPTVPKLVRGVPGAPPTVVDVPSHDS